MSPTQLMERTLVHRIIDACEAAPTIDKAVARTAGVLYPALSVRRVDVWLHINQDRLLLVGTWASFPTRVKKGAVIRTSASSFADVCLHSAVVLDNDVPEHFGYEVLRDEGVVAWAAIPIPRPGRIRGLLTLSAHNDVFEGARDLLEDIGLSVGDRLEALAKASPTYLYASESIA
jgi:hypothetical protein